jgi:hypothetical protein
MIYVSAGTDEIPRRRGLPSSGAMTVLLAAFALASGAAAWLAGSDSVASLSSPAFLKDTPAPSFDDRFSVDSFDDRFSGNSTRNLLYSDIPPRPPARSMLGELEVKLPEAKGRLAQKLQSQDWKTALIEQTTPSEPAPSTVSAVPLPLPRSRPVEANLELQGGPPTTQSDNRTLLQKLSDLLPGRITLASLAPDGGFLGNGPDLAALGYDNLTAVYDISAHVVYMPSGSKLEAHSGFGRLMDDPVHVSERNVGATPPNIYDLKPREQLFHGVQALRMIPVGDNDTLGRSGLLAHSYMLGPNGDSNGCVSIKNYEKFLQAFQNGEIRRLVVVASLSDGVATLRRSASRS